MQPNLRREVYTVNWRDWCVTKWLYEDGFYVGTWAENKQGRKDFSVSFL